MAVLSRETEEKEALEALALDRRSLCLVVRTSRLLRKPGNRNQRRGLEESRRSAVEQIDDQMRRMNRQPFRGSSSVEIEVRAPLDRSDSKVKPIAKEYLDLLNRHVIPDDATVDHMIFLIRFEDRENTEAQIQVRPSRLFSIAYDRAFRVDADLSGLNEDLPETDSAMEPFDESDISILKFQEGVLDMALELDEEENDLWLEDPDGNFTLEVPSGYEEFRNADTRASVIRDHLETCRNQRGFWFTDHWFDYKARPGREPFWEQELLDFGVADIGENDRSSPGWIEVTPPPTSSVADGAKPWRRELCDAWKHELASDSGWQRMALPKPLILDIALVGSAGSKNDIDNVAYKVISSFERELAFADPVVRGFRTYRVRGEMPQVLAKPLRVSRLEDLLRRVQISQAHVIRDRKSRQRAALEYPPAMQDLTA